jgi:hypothetical protein
MCEPAFDMFLFQPACNVTQIIRRSHRDHIVNTVDQLTGRSISYALTVFIHGMVMIVGVCIDWQRHCVQFEH